MELVRGTGIAVTGCEVYGDGRRREYGTFLDMRLKVLGDVEDTLDT
jgi:hypothetical protein